MKFKFKSSEFVGYTTNPIQIAARAQEVLEAELGKCKRLFWDDKVLPIKRGHRSLDSVGDTHTAVLFNVEPIGEGEK